MITKLLAGRWSTDGTTLLEQFDNPANIGIRINIPRGFGVDRIEVTVKASSQYDLVDRLVNHYGQRIAVYSSWLTQPISGYIYQIEKVSRGEVKYIARGAGWRHYDHLVTYEPQIGDTIDDIITDVLTTSNVEVLSGDTSHIEANTTDFGAIAQNPRGYPGDLMTQAVKIDNAGDGYVFDYFVKDEPFSGLTLQDFTPYYKQRGDRAPDWIITRDDMSSWRLSRDIEDFATTGRVYYGKESGTQGNRVTGSTESTQFTDSTADFVAQGVSAGDAVYNTTDGSRATVITVDSSIQITHTPLQGGTANVWTNTTSDNWIVIARNSTTSAEQINTATPWYREIEYREPGLTATNAADIAALYTSSADVGRQSFTITAPTIRDSSGARWPLWEVCAQLDKRYIQIADFYPAANQFSSNQTRNTFIIVGLDYDHSSRALTVEVDRPDKRMDVRLRIAGITKSDAVRRGR